MKPSSAPTALRIAAAVFSVSLAAAYVSCRSGSAPPPEPEAAAAPRVFPSSKRAPVEFEVLPGSKSRVFTLPPATAELLDASSPEDSRQPEVFPQVFSGSKSTVMEFDVLPGSKSFIITPIPEETEKPGPTPPPADRP